MGFLSRLLDLYKSECLYEPLYKPPKKCNSLKQLCIHIIPFMNEASLERAIESRKWSAETLAYENRGIGGSYL